LTKTNTVQASYTSQTAIKTERLPFTVKIARNESQLAKAVLIRSEAYGRHWPNLTNHLREPESQDRNPSSLVLLAESKISGQPLGTMRIDTNLGSHLQIERDFELPDNIRNSPIAYVTRLGVKQGRIGTLVKLCLFKSIYRYCLANQLGWVLAGVRPPNDRDYIRLGFQDLAHSGALVPITSSGGIPVRILALDIVSAERQWHSANNPLYAFMLTTFHPDIEIFNSVRGMWAHPRRTYQSSTQALQNLDFLELPIA
jgi:hypothetical protein